MRPGGPPIEDEAWVAELLLPGERRLWGRMSKADRRHAIGVGRRVERALGNEATRPVLAAALLHDVGKVIAGLGTYGRVVATISGAIAGHGAAPAWSERRGLTRRVGLYLRHPELGAELLEVAGSHPVTVTWTREHHLPAEQWTLPTPIAEALKDADDD